jgi:hypothetical protein
MELAASLGLLILLLVWATYMVAVVDEGLFDGALRRWVIRKLEGDDDE